MRQICLERALVSKYAIHIEALVSSKHYLIIFDTLLMADSCLKKLSQMSNLDNQDDKSVWDWVNDQMLVLAEIEELQLYYSEDSEFLWRNDTYGKTLVLNSSSFLVADLEI